MITTYKQYINIKIVGRNGMGRNRHGSIWLWAEMSSDPFSFPTLSRVLLYRGINVSRLFHAQHAL